MKRSCLTLSQSLNQNMNGVVTPFISIQEDQCTGRKIQATITMKVCNKKSVSISTFADKTKAYFGGELVQGFDNVFDKPLLGNSCHSFTFEKEMNLCQTEFKYSMAFHGSVDGGECGNYQWLKSTVELYAPPPPNAPSRIEKVCKTTSDNGRLCDTSVSFLRLYTVSY